MDGAVLITEADRSRWVTAAQSRAVAWNCERHGRHGDRHISCVVAGGNRHVTHFATHAGLVKALVRSVLADAETRAGPLPPA